MLPLRESNRFRGFPFELDCFRRSGLEVNRHFVAVLIAALVDDFLHFRGRGFRKWERPNRHVVALRANGDLRAIRMHHEAFELIKSSLLRLWLHRSDDNGCSGISNDDRDGRRTLRRRRRRRKDARRRKVDRKSTRLNSSHGYISYAVFCLKKKKKTKHDGHICHRYM